VKHTIAFLLTVPLALPLSAAGPAPKWTVGLHAATPSLGGHFREAGGGASAFKTNFDIERDLGLEADGVGMGLHASYMGSRFGLSLDYMAADFAGARKVTEKLEFAGYTFPVDVDVASSLKTTIVDFNWTIKVWRPGSAWLGVDLGVQYWGLDAEASGTATGQNQPWLPPQQESIAESFAAPIPQVGVSGGFSALGDRLEARARVSFVSYSGASYTRIGVDGRYWPLDWLGLRAFFDSQSLDAPEGSIVADVEAALDRSAIGFGVAFRF
jgi:hypothetical protein